jgi:hypothetical protein
MSWKYSRLSHKIRKHVLDHLTPEKIKTTFGLDVKEIYWITPPWDKEESDNDRFVILVIDTYYNSILAYTGMARQKAKLYSHLENYFNLKSVQISWE